MNRVYELIETWINGNRKDVARELAFAPRWMSAAVATILASEHALADAETLIRLLGRAETGDLK